MKAKVANHHNFKQLQKLRANYSVFMATIHSYGAEMYYDWQDNVHLLKKDRTEVAVVTFNQFKEKYEQIGLSGDR